MKCIPVMARLIVQQPLFQSSVSHLFFCNIINVFTVTSLSQESVTAMRRYSLCSDGGIYWTIKVRTFYLGAVICMRAILACPQWNLDERWQYPGSLYPSDATDAPFGRAPPRVVEKKQWEESEMCNEVESIGYQVCLSHLVFLLEWPYIIKSRGGEQRGRVTEQLTAGSHRQKHLIHTNTRGRQNKNKTGKDQGDWEKTATNQSGPLT